LFYIQQTVLNSWSRNVLLQQIATGLFHRKGRAVTSFESTLPKAQSDLARETLKNPFIFEILGLTEEMQERELEKAFTQDIKKLMLELGRGFAYVGNQYNLVVEKDDYFLDLLFYNYLLHCFVVFELKIGDFKPEYTGKLNFYINTIDAQIKGAIDAPTIGVLLCKTPNETVVKYALKGVATPMGVAQYEFTKALPKQLKGEMPSVKELQDQLDATSALLQKPIDEKKNKLKSILDKIKNDEIR
jgi:predicted nuclease of restriction endonuclease-like (RecB) superfamily